VVIYGAFEQTEGGEEVATPITGDPR